MSFVLFILLAAVFVLGVACYGCFCYKAPTLEDGNFFDRTHIEDCDTNHQEQADAARRNLIYSKVIQKDVKIGNKEMNRKSTIYFWPNANATHTDLEGKCSTHVMSKEDIHADEYKSIRRSVRNSIGHFRSSVTNKVIKKAIGMYTVDTCFICLESYKVGDKIFWSRNNKCSHSFHSDCMVRWLQQNNDCPICRQDYLFDSNTDA